MYDLKQLYSGLQAKIKTIQEHAILLDSIEFMTDKEQTDKASKKLEGDIIETNEKISAIQALIKSEESEINDLKELNLNSLVELDKVRKMLEDSNAEGDSLREFDKDKNSDDLISVNGQKVMENTSSRNLGIIFDTANNIKQILKDSHKTLNNTISWLEPILISQKDQESIVQRQFSNILKLKKCIEDLGKIQCAIRDKSTIEIKIFNKPLDDTHLPSNLNQNNEHGQICLGVRIIFDNFQENYFKIHNIELDQNLLNCDEMLEITKTSSDIPMLVTFLKSVWASSACLITEIETLREKHAIDWIPKERTLLLMTKAKASCVCSLDIPEKYPWSGSISLKNVTGLGLENDDIMPNDKSLTGWISYLEDLVSKNIQA